MTEEEARRVAHLVQQGRKIEAIKLLRDATGMDLQQAKEEVDRLASSSSETSSGAIAPYDNGAVPDDIREIALQGNRIEAIKQLRERTGLGLKEAKDRIDATTGSKSGCMGSLLLMISAGALIALLAGA